MGTWASNFLSKSIFLRAIVALRMEPQRDVLFCYCWREKLGIYPTRVKHTPTGPLFSLKVIPSGRPDDEYVIIEDSAHSDCNLMGCLR